MTWLGLRGTDALADNEDPESWREGILRRYPNGAAPLTALTSKMRSEELTSFTHNWFTKALPEQRGAVTEVYDDGSLTTPYSNDGTAGNTIYVKLGEAQAAEFRAGHKAMLYVAAQPNAMLRGQVTAVLLAGANSKISFKLLEADDNVTDHANFDTIWVIGNMNAQGSTMPQSIAYSPLQLTNYTNIWITPLRISRTLAQTTLRTGPAYNESRREILELHGIEVEKDLIFGIKSLGVGSNGLPITTTDGLVTAIQTYVAANPDSGIMGDFANDAEFAGQTWLAGGETWLDNMLEKLFAFSSGNNEKLVYCGMGVMAALGRLVKNLGHFEFNEKTKGYGIKVNEWHTSFGTLNFQTHPLFTQTPGFSNAMLVIEPRNLIWRYLQDTTYVNSITKEAMQRANLGEAWIDGRIEGYVTEAMLEYHFPETMGFYTNVGVDNELA